MTIGPDLEWACLMYRLIISCKIYAYLDERKIYFNSIQPYSSVLCKWMIAFEKSVTMEVEVEIIYI